MSETNDPELSERALAVQQLARLIDATMATGRVNAVVTLAAQLEDAARKLGWRAQELNR